MTDFSDDGTIRAHADSGETVEINRAAYVRLLEDNRRMGEALTTIRNVARQQYPVSVELNDNGRTFKEIASIIESEPAGLFE